MTIVSDLPFVTADHIDDVLTEYYKRNKPAMCVSVSEELFKEYDGLIMPAAPSIAPKFEDSSDKLSNKYLILDTDNVELAFNINTLHDLDKSGNLS